MSLLSFRVALFATLVSVSAAASLDWNSFLSYDNTFIKPDYILSKPWEKDNSTLDAVQSIVVWADAVSTQGPWSVTQKPFPASSGDIHDYASWAPYWWPNCTGIKDADQLTQQEIWKTCPYEQRDGQFVPDVRLINDTGSYAALCDAVLYTSLAWVITDDNKYADRAITYLKTWFLDEATHMNPNLKYTQVVRGPPGNQEGSHYGVLDLKTVPKILTAIFLFRKTDYAGWKPYDEPMRKWSRDIVDWLETYHFGKEEMESQNNHGTFFFNTMAGYQLIAGNETEAKRYLDIYFNGIYMDQIDDKGEQPFEVHRSRTYHYRTYGAYATLLNCQLGEFVGYNGWDKTTKNGSTVQDAVDWALQFDPAATNEVQSSPAQELYSLVAQISAHYGDPDGKYAAYLARVQPNYPVSPYFLWAQPLALSTGYAVSGSIASVRNNTTDTPSTPGHDGAASFGLSHALVVASLIAPLFFSLDLPF